MCEAAHSTSFRSSVMPDNHAPAIPVVLLHDIHHIERWHSQRVVIHVLSLILDLGCMTADVTHCC